MSNTNKPDEGEQEMVAEFMSKTVLELQPLIEGKFVDFFVVTFGLDGKEYELSLKKIKDSYLPTICQSKEDGVCNLKMGSCQQCLYQPTK